MTADSNTIGSRQSAPAVWAVLGMLVIAHLVFLSAFGIDLPYYDEWDGVVPVATDAREVDLNWLWSQFSDHRVPLPRLVYVGLGKICDWDFRAIKYFNLALLGALAVIFVRAVRKIRGAGSLSDLVFPCLLLHGGVLHEIFFGWQVTFLLPSFLVGLAAVLLATRKDELNFKWVIGMGLLILSLPLCGANGVALGASLSAWAVVAGGVGAFFTGSFYRSRHLLLLLLFGLSAGALVVFYFHDYRPGVPRSEAPDWLAVIETAGSFFLMGFGPAGALSAGAVGSLLAFLIAFSVLLSLVWFGVKRRHDLFFLSGFSAVGGGLLLISLGIGYGRGHGGDSAGTQVRYCILAAPFLAWLSLLAVRWIGGTGGRMVSATLALLLLGLFPLNTVAGLQWHHRNHEIVASVERDLEEGMALDAVAAKHADLYGIYPDEGRLHGGLVRLAEARIGPFRDFPSGPEPLPPQDSFFVRGSIELDKEGDLVRRVPSESGELICHWRRIDLPLLRYKSPPHVQVIVDVHRDELDDANLKGTVWKDITSGNSFGALSPVPAGALTTYFDRRSTLIPYKLVDLGSETIKYLTQGSYRIIIRPYRGS